MVDRISDYAMIGNCETAALVSKAGSIDWLCMPRFDSPALFARLLGVAENGCWSMSPEGVWSSSRRYWDGTLILETTFTTINGTASLIDFMVPHADVPTLVRLVDGLDGRVDFVSDLIIRFDYGRAIPWVERDDEGGLTALAGPARVTVRGDAPFCNVDRHLVSRFSVLVGRRVAFAFQYQESTAAKSPIVSTDTALITTKRFWLNFSDRCPSVEPWSANIKRSLITLKALTYEPTGGIVAAPTTSLPEWIGGQRNWDYRYCWLRDASFTLQAFMQLGYFSEAQAWRDWLMRAIAGDATQMQIMYGVSGERDLWERELTWLPGFRNSQPVRIGNGAASQVQLDIYGEVTSVADVAAAGGLPEHPRAEQLRTMVLDHLETAWREPDEGIWEVRSGRQHFVHSKVMCWLTFDRLAAALEKEWANDGRVARLRAVAEEIHSEVCQNGFDEKLNSFVMAYGSKQLDASQLLLPLVGFLPPDDPRIVGTVDAIAAGLTKKGLVQRYNTSFSADGFALKEGSFLLCSFWLVIACCRIGRLEFARELFDKLLTLCNDVGLLAEEYDLDGQEMLGNFPQAFSHVGLILAAIELNKKSESN